MLTSNFTAAPTHQSAKFVFSTFNDGTGADGPGWSVRASPAYVAAIGVLMSQYTITGTPKSGPHLYKPAESAQVLTHPPICQKKLATLRGAPLSVF